MCIMMDKPKDASGHFWTPKRADLHETRLSWRSGSDLLVFHFLIYLFDNRLFGIGIRHVGHRLYI